VSERVSSCKGRFAVRVATMKPADFRDCHYRGGRSVEWVLRPIGQVVSHKGNREIVVLNIIWNRCYRHHRAFHLGPVERVGGAS